MAEEMTQEMKDDVELSRYTAHISMARVQMADLERERTALRRDVETLTANLRRRRDELKAEITALTADREKAREETAAIHRELQAAEQERIQARGVIRRAVLLQDEIKNLHEAHDRLSTEVLERRAELEAAQGAHTELKAHHKTVAAQVADAEARLLARHAEQTAVEQEMATARHAIEGGNVALQAAKDAHGQAAAKLYAREEKVRLGEARLTIWEKTLEERELVLERDEATSKAELSGIAHRERAIVSGAAELAKSKLAFQQHAGPKLAELEQRAGELEIQEQHVRDLRGQLDAEQQELRVTRSKVESERAKLAKAQLDVQKGRDEVKAFIKRFGLEESLGHVLKRK